MVEYKKEKGSIGIVLLFCVIIVGILAFLYLSKKSESTRKNSSPASVTLTGVPKNDLQTPSPVSVVESSKIAYVKDRQIYILDSSGSHQLTKDVYASNIKWSADGNFIGWMNNKDIAIYYKESNYTSNQTVGISISRINIKTGNIEEIVPPKFPLDQLEELAKKNIYNFFTDFDFAIADGSKVVYIQNGVWVKDVKTNKEEQLLQNNHVEGPAVDTKSYFHVSWNRESNKILLDVSLWEISAVQVYDLESKQLTKFDTLSNKQSLWIPAGQQLLSFSQTGRDEGGLWLTSVADKHTQTILGKNKEVFSVVSAALSQNGQKLIAIIEPFPGVLNQPNLPISGRGIYSVTSDGVISPLLAKDMSSVLSWSADGKSITFLVGIKPANEQTTTPRFDLVCINSDGTGEKILLRDISSYTWLPT